MKIRRKKEEEKEKTREEKRNKESDERYQEFRVAPDEDSFRAV